MVTLVNEDSRLSISVRCFVCGDVVPLSFVLGNGKRKDYYGPSNFYRHIVRHTKTKSVKSERTRSSKTSTQGETKRELKAKRSRSGNKRRKNNTSSESEGSDAEKISKMIVYRKSYRTITSTKAMTW